HEAERAHGVLGAGAGEVLSPHPARRAARPLAIPAHHAGDRRAGGRRRALRRWRHPAGLHRTSLGAGRGADLDTRRRTPGCGVAASGVLVALAHYRRPTLVSAARSDTA